MPKDEFAARKALRTLSDTRVYHHNHGIVYYAFAITPDGHYVFDVRPNTGKRFKLFFEFQGEASEVWGKLTRKNKNGSMRIKNPMSYLKVVAKSLTKDEGASYYEDRFPDIK